MGNQPDLLDSDGRKTGKITLGTHDVHGDYNAEDTHDKQAAQDSHIGPCDKPMCTGDKILTVAIDLMSDKGYKTVTTKEIASEAGVSEMTVFRHFGCKLKILQDAIDKFSCAAPLKHLFEERLKWELEADLLEISRSYHEMMNRNRRIMLISLKDGNNIPELKEHLSKHPELLKGGLMAYFSTMQELGKVIKADPETLAVTFLSMNFGAFMGNIISEDEAAKVPGEQHMAGGVKIFARGLTP